MPPRLRDDAGGRAVAESERARWLDEVGALLALQAAREQCEALGLLVLVRYMPLHHTSDPESLDPLSDLIASHKGGVAAAAPPSSALYALLAGTCLDERLGSLLGRSVCAD